MGVEGGGGEFVSAGVGGAVEVGCWGGGMVGR